jgi:hypothetical protein
LTFIEFGDQGSALDTSQRKAALEVIHDAKRPLLFVYIHGWQNNAESADVCRFEHFIDTVSRFPEMTGRKTNVIGIYIAWRGLDLTVPGLNFFTFWSRKSAGATIAAQNGRLATISELALAARAPDKTYHHCVLLGHSFGGLVLENTGSGEQRNVIQSSGLCSIVPNTPYTSYAMTPREAEEIRIQIEEAVQRRDELYGRLKVSIEDLNEVERLERQLLKAQQDIVAAFDKRRAG